MLFTLQQNNTLNLPSVANRLSLSDFCAKYALRLKAMVEIRKLRRQLVNEVNLLLPSLRLDISAKLETPGEERCLLLRQIVLSGMVNQVARKVQLQYDYDALSASSRFFKLFHLYCVLVIMLVENSFLLGVYYYYKPS